MSTLSPASFTPRQCSDVNVYVIEQGNSKSKRGEPPLSDLSTRTPSGFVNVSPVRSTVLGGVFDSSSNKAKSTDCDPNFDYDAWRRNPGLMCPLPLRCHTCHTSLNENHWKTLLGLGSGVAGGIDQTTAMKMLGCASCCATVLMCNLTRAQGVYGMAQNS